MLRRVAAAGEVAAIAEEKEGTAPPLVDGDPRALLLDADDRGDPCRPLPGDEDVDDEEAWGSGCIPLCETTTGADDRTGDASMECEGEEGAPPPWDDDAAAAKSGKFVNAVDPPPFFVVAAAPSSGADTAGRPTWKDACFPTLLGLLMDGDGEGDAGAAK